MSVCVIVVVVVGGGGSSSSSSQAEKHIRRHYHVICYYVELCWKRRAAATSGMLITNVQLDCRELWLFYDPWGTQQTFLVNYATGRIQLRRRRIRYGRNRCVESARFIELCWSISRTELHTKGWPADEQTAWFRRHMKPSDYFYSRATLVLWRGWSSDRKWIQPAKMSHLQFPKGSSLEGTGSNLEWYLEN